MAKDGSGFEKRLEAAMPKDAPPNGDAPAETAGIGDAGQASPMGGGRSWSPVRRPVPTPGPRLPEPTHGRDHGEPVAWRHAQRVRRAAWGNGPAAMPAPRPRPTHPCRRLQCDRMSAEIRVTVAASPLVLRRRGLPMRVGMTSHRNYSRQMSM